MKSGLSKDRVVGFDRTPMLSFYAAVAGLLTPFLRHLGGRYRWEAHYKKGAGLMQVVPVPFFIQSFYRFLSEGHHATWRVPGMAHGGAYFSPLLPSRPSHPPGSLHSGDPVPLG